MKLDHLNFEQLHRLQSAENLIRFHAHYHGLLEARWKELNVPFLFTVWSAEQRFADLAHRYRPVEKILKSTELQHALWRAAKWETVERTNNSFQHYVSIPRYEQHSHHKAALIVMHCLWNCAAAHIRINGTVLEVHVETTPLGVKLLHYKPVHLKRVKDWCTDRGLNLIDVVPWLSYLPEEPEKVVPSRYPSLPYVAEIAITLSSRANL